MLASLPTMIQTARMQLLYDDSTAPGLASKPLFEAFFSPSSSSHDHMHDDQDVGLFLFVPGFLCKPIQYQSLFKALNNSGYHVISYHVPDESPTSPISIEASAWILESLIHQAVESSLKADGRKVKLAVGGHSRGGKIITASLKRLSHLNGVGSVEKVVLIDPVDRGYEPSDEASCLESTSLSSSDSNGMNPFFLIIGCGRNKDCIPSFGNYQAFDQALSLYGREHDLVLFPEAGHFDILDSPSLLQESSCSRGKNVARDRQEMVTAVERFLTSRSSSRDG